MAYITYMYVVFDCFLSNLVTDARRDVCYVWDNGCDNWLHPNPNPTDLAQEFPNGDRV